MVLRNSKRKAEDSNEVETDRGHDSSAGMMGEESKQPFLPPKNPPPRVIAPLQKVSDCYELKPHSSLKVTVVAKTPLPIGTSVSYVGRFVDMIKKNFSPAVQTLGPILGGFCILTDPSAQQPGYIEQTTDLEPVVLVTVNDGDSDLICSVGLNGEGLLAYMDRSKDYEDCNAIVVYVNESYPRIQLTKALKQGDILRLFQSGQTAGVPNTTGTTCWFSVFLHIYGDLGLHTLLADSPSVVVRRISKFVREMETYKYRDENSTICDLESIFALLNQFIKGGVRTTFDLAEFWHLFFNKILPEGDYKKIEHHMTTTQTDITCAQCDTIKISIDSIISLPMCYLDERQISEDLNDLMETLPTKTHLTSRRHCVTCKKLTNDVEVINYTFGEKLVVSIPRKISTKNSKTGETHIKKLHNQVFAEPLVQFKDEKRQEHKYVLSGVVLHQRRSYFQTDTIASSYSVIDGGHYTYARYAQLTADQEMNLFNDACVTTKSAIEILVNCSRKVVFVVLSKLNWIMSNGSPMAISPLALNQASSSSEEKKESPPQDFSRLKHSQTPNDGGQSIVKQLEEAHASRKAAEELLHSILDSTPAAVSMLDKND